MTLLFRSAEEGRLCHVAALVKLAMTLRTGAAIIQGHGRTAQADAPRYLDVCFKLQSGIAFVVGCGIWLTLRILQAFLAPPGAPTELLLRKGTFHGRHEASRGRNIPWQYKIRTYICTLLVQNSTTPSIKLNPYNILEHIPRYVLTDIAGHAIGPPRNITTSPSLQGMQHIRSHARPWISNSYDRSSNMNQDVVCMYILGW